MSTEQLDPQGRETQELLAAARLDDRLVLDVGVGDGRLAFRIAGAVRSLIGVDVNPAELASAARTCPPDLRERIRLLPGDATALPFLDRQFDLAILSWSL